jgi:large subunit ribosomal protein L9
MATVQVILKEKIANLGAEADTVTVRAGYARNFLVPHGKAYEATAGNLRHVKKLKEQRAVREAAERTEAQALAAKIKKQSIKLELATGSSGKAFGAITNMDIAKALEANGISVDRHSIQLDKPIKGTGKFDVVVKVYTDVEAVIKLTVTAAGGVEESAPAEEVTVEA